MRGFAFYSILSLPIIVWGLIVIPICFGDIRIPAACVWFIVRSTPFIAQDVSVVGELTPGILAGLVIALLPSRRSYKITALALAVIVYFLYIYLSIFFSDETGKKLIGLYLRDPNESTKAMLSVVSSVRVTAIVIATSIIGFKLKTVTS